MEVSGTVFPIFECMQSTLGFAVNIESNEQEFLKPVIFFQVTASFI